MKETTITRPAQECCSTYTDTAIEIGKLPRDENFIREAATLIKLYGHQDKLSVYSRLSMIESDSFLREVLKLKVQTHEAILAEWDTGKWKPK